MYTLYPTYIDDECTQSTTGTEASLLAHSISAREARARFAEITDRVRYTGEPVIVEKQGRPFIALVSLEDLAEVQRVRRRWALDEFSLLAARAAHDVEGPEPTEDAIVNSVRETREALYHERYGAK